MPSGMPLEKNDFFLSQKITIANSFLFRGKTLSISPSQFWTYAGLCTISLCELICMSVLLGMDAVFLKLSTSSGADSLSTSLSTISDTWVEGFDKDISFRA